MSSPAIARRLGVTDKTVTKAVEWFAPPRGETREADTHICYTELVPHCSSACLGVAPDALPYCRAKGYNHCMDDERAKSSSGGSHERPAASALAAAAFERSLPAIVETVSERFRIEAESAHGAASGDELAFIQDSHAHFGRTLLAIAALDLFDQLPGEAAWYRRVLERRGFGKPAFLRVIRSWIMAILAAMPPAAGREIAAYLAWIESRIDGLPLGAGASPGGRSRDAEIFLEYIARGETERAVSHAVSLVERGSTVERIVDEVILGALVRVGALWERNEIGVADEHIATSAIRAAALRFFDRIPRSPDRGGTIVVACAPGNEHDIAPEVLSRYLESKGWRTVFIGRSAPEGELIRTIIALVPGAALISIALIAHLLPGLRAIERIKQEAPKTVVIAGGSAAIAAASVIGKAADAVAGSFADAERLIAERVVRHA